MNLAQKNVAPDALRSVGFVLGPTRFDLFVPLARRLKAQFGSRNYAYLRTQADLRAVNDLVADGTFEAAIAFDRILPALTATDEADAAAIFERARKIESRIGTTIGQLAMFHRHFGRGYALSGSGFPRTPLYSGADLAQMTRAFVDQVEFWENEIAGRNLTLILQGLPETAVIAKAHDVAYRFLIGARFSDYWFWSESQYQDMPELASIYQATTEEDRETVKSTYQAAAIRQASRRSGMGFSESARSSLDLAIRWPYWRLRGAVSGGPKAYIENVTTPWRRRARHREAQRYSRVKLADLAGRPFVFFPLHKEPEAALTARSPECFAQHAVIAAIARDLPAGVLLAVKEIAGISHMRPREFYAHLSDLKNVVFLDMDEPGVDVARAATATATITGSAGLEAAAAGKPVLAFGRHATYGFLPHVRVITEDRQIRPALEWALSPDFDHARARRDGARYVTALKRACFRLTNFAFAVRGKRSVGEDVVEAAVDGLLQSLRVTARL